jgi:peptide/nickel transport system permease protein
MMTAMLVFLFQRTVQGVAVLLTVALLAFLLFQYVGDPVAQMLGQDATPQQRAALRADLGLDQPAPVQFARFVGRAVQGDFGISLRQGRPVHALFVERLPATLELAGVAALLALLVGVPLGVFAARHRGTVAERLVMGASLLGVSLPTFLIGVLLILLFTVLWPILPSFGRGDVVAVGDWRTGLLTVDGWRHLVLPSLTLALFQMALIVRLVRSEMLEALRADHVRFARARGLSEPRIAYRHALPNTLVPVVTVVGLQLGSLIAFSIVTESVFQWPGLGQLFLQAVTFADIPVMAAYLCLVAVVFVVINVGVDVAYRLIDPRLRATGGRP